MTQRAPGFHAGTIARMIPAHIPHENSIARTKSQRLDFQIFIQYRALVR
jgi:hypothetical protein